MSCDFFVSEILIIKLENTYSVTEEVVVYKFPTFTLSLLYDDKIKFDLILKIINTCTCIISQVNFNLLSCILQADDGVPEPEIIIEVLKGCRNNNDYALAIRFLEVVRVSVALVEELKVI